MNITVSVSLKPLISINGGIGIFNKLNKIANKYNYIYIYLEKNKLQIKKNN